MRTLPNCKALIDSNGVCTQGGSIGQNKLMDSMLETGCQVDFITVNIHQLVLRRFFLNDFEYYNLRRLVVKYLAEK